MRLPFSDRYPLVMRPSYSALALAVSISGLLLTGCGGSTSSAPATSTTPPPALSPAETLTVTVRMPMQVQHARLVVSVPAIQKTLLDQADFSDFDAVIKDLKLADYQHQLLLVTLTPNANSTIYDAVTDRFVPFARGSLHALIQISGNTVQVHLTPASEAIYQRSLVRAGQVDFAQPVDPALIQPQHLNKATQEVNSALGNAFVVSLMPRFNSPISSWQTSGTTAQSDYTNLFIGLGLQHYLVKRYPQTVDSYVTLGQSLGVDLRDGSLDGRSLAGDVTAFDSLVQPAAPRNSDPARNTLYGIGDQQKTTRESFASAVQSATLDYAYRHNQNILNPANYAALQQASLFQPLRFSADSSTQVRWTGAGDYRRAFGFTGNELCNNSSVVPCRQGLNADDINTDRSDIDYLIGVHQAGTCRIQILPSGDVRIGQTGGNTSWVGQINRDASDNLLRVGAGHYLLNIGTGNTTPVDVIQLDIQDATIQNAIIGKSTNLYPQTLDRVSYRCR